MNLKSFLVASVILVNLFLAGPVSAGYEKQQKEIDALLSENKYASAASYILEKKALMNEPRFVRQYSHILVTYYTNTINFHIFSLLDLKKGEDIMDYRGKEGKHILSGGDLEKLLYDKHKKNPKSPDINFAVGEYLSRGEECGCGQPTLFTGARGDDFNYFMTAYEGGVHDYWSLFRIAYHYHKDPDVPLEKVAPFYEKSLEARPNHTAAAYNLAFVYYQQQKIEEARKLALKTLGRYGDPTLDADTYNLFGHIEIAAGNAESAEKNLKKALKLVSWHDKAFVTLIQLYRTSGKESKYIEQVKEYIAQDYSNNYPFNVYVDYLSRLGVEDPDRKILKYLAGLELDDPVEVGAVNFNLGRAAELMGDKELALKRYEKSLKAFKKAENPPEGGVDALKHLIARVK